MTTTTTPTADLTALAARITTAERRLETHIPAADVLHHANSVNILADLVSDELKARSLRHDVAMSLVEDSATEGMKACGELLYLQMLRDAPDLLQLAVQRLIDEMEREVFDVKHEVHA